MSTRITTQAALDAALTENPDGTFELEGSAYFSVMLQAGKPRFRLFGSVRLFLVGENSSVEAWGSSSVEAWENSSVVARESASVVARGSASVVARGNSSVEAWENSSVVARGNSSVVARESSSVVAWESSSVEAWGNSSVEAWGNSSVVARESASVVARGSSSVEAWENSSVVARESSSVVARESSSVVAWESSSVEAWGNVFLRIFSALKITAAVSVAIIKHGPASSIEGGTQLEAVPEPGNWAIGAEWAEFHGIKLDAPFKVDSIDARIAAAIDQNQGHLNMEDWHGEKCDETNWCGTSHCRAGYAICLAGKEGFAIERKYGPEHAARMIYAVSRPDQPLPDFFADTDTALEDIRACAAPAKAEAAS